ncbi:lytic transglycosylase domain-containing protein [Sphingomonas donggukensis]|uniref:Lytic transglycosylase domain-containing protein n=1 Tax=Sphingomonas donggukensis TaxID=2949093 RepID=A0ABY4TVW5_9SPHN|nr:lytic transglycosylase domain-containing protein [Sphingomonas donggukensis]URW76462.1 lytic transglycosylase domain-containing protein [Sphingomonas donggukensis]
MRSAFVLALLATAVPVAAHAADGAAPPTAATPATADPDQRFPTSSAAPRGDGIPDQLDGDQRAAYRGVFASIRAGNWTDAQLQLDAMKPGPLHALARAEMFTAKGSPKVALEPLMAVLTEAPELPQAAQLAKLAKSRGAEMLPSLPAEQRLIWYDGAPNRQRAAAIKSDAASADLAVLMQPLIKDDRGAEAEALVESKAALLTPEALVEWRQRVAWIHYVDGNDASARRVAALAQAGSGEWAAQADWVAGLSAWRAKDYAGAGASFASVARRASDADLRAAGLYWASRADMASGRPDLVQARLQNAAQFPETFYGQLARQQLGVTTPITAAGEKTVADDWRDLARRPNVRVAAALVEIGETDLADEVLRQQAKIGDRSEFPALTRLAGRLDLPATQLWLSHNCPQGAAPTMASRYPTPNWTPDGGWRVDKALVYAHTLQESRFRIGVVSPAGAYGLMQIMPAAATDIARQRGLSAIDRTALTRPSTNIEVGQSYLEKLRDQPATGGLLPKVIAAYNAGPLPVSVWNARARDGGDPLLYIESIPYWETRGYVMTVLRNYWMYEGQAGKASTSRAALSQGLWPKFPGMTGAGAVRMTVSGIANAITRAN